MNIGARLRRAAYLTLAISASSCGDPAAPTPATEMSVNSEQSALLGGLLGTVSKLLFAPVERSQPLPTDVSWEFDVSPQGGFTYNRETGLSVFVPSGAVRSNVTIKVTALAGDDIAYRFEPHIEFQRPVVLTQDIRNTGLLGLLRLPILRGAHFEGDVPEFNSNGSLRVTELVPVLASLFTRTASFAVDHFSGWILASGYDAE